MKTYYLYDASGDVFMAEVGKNDEINFDDKYVKAEDCEAAMTRLVDITKQMLEDMMGEGMHIKDNQAAFVQWLKTDMISRPI